MWLYWRLFLVGVRILGRQRRDLVLENLILRQQLAVWERSGRRPMLHRRDRQFWSITARSWTAWRTHLQLVQPATVVGWHRLAWRHSWRWRSRGVRLGRPASTPRPGSSSCGLPRRIRPGACARSRPRSWSWDIRSAPRRSHASAAAPVPAQNSIRPRSPSGRPTLPIARLEIPQKAAA